MRVIAKFAFGLLLGVLAGKAIAQHECQGGHTCNEDGEVIAQVTGDSTKVYSLGGSDMEINDCLATHSVLFGLWQSTHTNPYCEADKMDARGDHQGAAEMRCSTRKYRKVYGKDCVDAVIYVPEPEVSYVDEWSDDWEELYTAQQQEIEAVKEELAVVTKQAQMKVTNDGAERRARAKAAGDKVRKGEQ